MSPGVPTVPNVPLARWLPDDVSPIARHIVERAMKDVGLCEVPLGSNRSPEIDEYNRAAKVPQGSFWCASWVAAVWRDVGLEIPPFPAGCDEWMGWAKKTGRWSVKPALGAAVVYGKPGDANHIGVIVRLAPELYSIEGNTTIGAHDRNGTVVTLKRPELARVLGYVHPRPL